MLSGIIWGSDFIKEFENSRGILKDLVNALCIFWLKCVSASFFGASLNVAINLARWWRFWVTVIFIAVRVTEPHGTRQKSQVIIMIIYLFEKESKMEDRTGSIFGIADVLVQPRHLIKPINLTQYEFMLLKVIHSVAVIGSNYHFYYAWMLSSLLKIYF